MSDAVGALNSACDQEAVPAHRWPSVSAGRFPPGQQHPRDLRLRLWGWEKDEQRNTGHLGKKEMLHKCSWQRGEGETTLSHWACSEQYSSRCPSNQSSRKYCCCHTHAADLGGKPCSTEKHSPEEAMTPLLTTVGRQHSTLFLLGWYDLLVYKTETAYACETYHLQWLHKHLCMWTKNKHQGENPPQTPPPPPLEALWLAASGLLTWGGRGKARLGRICTSLPGWPEPHWESPVPLSFPQPSGSSRLGPGLLGRCQ